MSELGFFFAGCARPPSAVKENRLPAFFNDVRYLIERSAGKSFRRFEAN